MKGSQQSAELVGVEDIRLQVSVCSAPVFLSVADVPLSQDLSTGIGFIRKPATDRQERESVLS